MVPCTQLPWEMYRLGHHTYAMQMNKQNMNVNMQGKHTSTSIYVYIYRHMLVCTNLHVCLQPITMYKFVPQHYYPPPPPHIWPLPDIHGLLNCGGLGLGVCMQGKQVAINIGTYGQKPHACGLPTMPVPASPVGN